MNQNIELMSDVTHYMKYAKFVEEEKRRETWIENCDRTRDMHIRRYPQLVEEITHAFDNFVRPKYVVPSMRSMQFSGLPIELNNARLYNCSFLLIDSWKAFREIMFLLLGGVGVGYSVQYRHIGKLPSIRKPVKTKKYSISDDLIGWANAVEVLTKAYLDGGYLPHFDYRGIRKKGTPLKTSGGKAPGPEPLKRALTKIQNLFDSKENGQKLTPLESHDIACYIADAVLSGGIREAAMIAIFSPEDNEMARSKSNFVVKILEEVHNTGDSFQVVVETNGWMPAKSHTLYLTKDQYEQAKTTNALPWWLFEPQRGRANNSAILLRDGSSADFEFRRLWKLTQSSGAGEPGILFADDLDTGTNPCAEIGLRPNQFCNLCDINVASVVSQEDFEQRVKAAAFIGTLQAGYTDFHYLRDSWKETTEAEALLGISMTGIASIDIMKLDLEAGAKAVVNENRRVAAIIGIKPAARTTCVKPSGTTALVMGTSSGIHAWYSPYYIRRLRVVKTEALYGYLKREVPELMEDSLLDPNNTAYLLIPIKAPEGATVTKEQAALSFLEKVKYIHEKWVKPGHISGTTSHNVSATAHLKDHEWDDVGNWLWANRHYYNGMSVLPLDNHSYQQAPFEEITEAKFDELNSHIKSIDLTRVYEEKDETKRAEEKACAGGICEVGA